MNLKSEEKINRAIISDVDPSIVNLLNAVKEKPHELAEELQTFRNMGDSENYYRISLLKKMLNLRDTPQCFFV